jgi:hypothetical protein
MPSLIAVHTVCELDCAHFPNESNLHRTQAGLAFDAEPLLPPRRDSAWLTF